LEIHPSRSPSPKLKAHQLFFIENLDALTSLEPTGPSQYHGLCSVQAGHDFELVADPEPSLDGPKLNLASDDQAAMRFFVFPYDRTDR
jgi:hypothetical protein